MISIPYGAIKSVFCRQLPIFQCHISIPYGAIKSDCMRTMELLISEFQFLMVRLKEKQVDVIKSLEEISIPYGAIKRTEEERDYLFEL
mgnify:CR=1 FL=1